MSEEKEVTTTPDPSTVTEETIRKFFDNLTQQREKLRALLETSIKGDLPSRKDILQMLVHAANTLWLLDEMLRSIFTDMVLLAEQHGGMVQEFLKVSHALGATQKVLMNKGIISEEEMKTSLQEILVAELEEAEAQLDKLSEQKKEEKEETTSP